MRASDLFLNLKITSIIFWQVYTFMGSIQSASERLRVWIDNVVIVDLWSSLSTTEASGSICFSSAAAFYDVYVEYKKSVANDYAGARLYWMSGSMGIQAVPSSQYFLRGVFLSKQIFVTPSVVCCSLGMLFGDGLTLATAGFSSSFRIQLMDDFGNLRLCGSDEIRIDSNFRVSDFNSFCANETYTFEYQVLEEAGYDYVLQVRIGQNHLLGSPFSLNIDSGLVNESVSVLIGTAASVATAGSISTFTIQARDSFGSKILRADLRFIVLVKDFGLLRVFPIQPGFYLANYQITHSSFYRFSLHSPKASGLRLTCWSNSQGGSVDKLVDSKPVQGPDFLGSPDENIVSTSSYLAQWDGLIWPPLAQMFSIGAAVTDSQDRIRLWIDQKLIIDQWSSLSGLEVITSFSFDVLGGYNISVRYKHVSNQAGLRLLWSSVSPYSFDLRPIDSTFFTDLPRRQNGRKFDVFVSPGDQKRFSIPTANFSIATVGMQAKFSIVIKDLWGNLAGNHVDIIAQLFSDSLPARPTHAFVKAIDVNGAFYDARIAIPASAGKYYLLVAQTLPGLSATYYIDPQLSAPLLSESASNIDFSAAGLLRPFGALSGNIVGVRWMGFVRPEVAHLHTFSISVSSESERVRLWVDNIVILDQWISLSFTNPSGTIWLGTAHSYYSLRLDYKQTNTSSSSATKLLWNSGLPSLDGVIPSSRLYSQKLTLGDDPFQISVHSGRFCASTSTHSFAVNGLQTVPYVSTFSIAVRDSYGNLLDGSNPPALLHVRSVSVDGVDVSVGDISISPFSPSTLNVILTITKAGLYRVMIAGLTGHGLIGAYFRDRDCRQIEMVRVANSSTYNWDLGVLETQGPKNIKCFRWTGFLHISISANYTFIFDGDADFSLILDGISNLRKDCSDGLSISRYLYKGVFPIKVICRSETYVQACSFKWKKADESEATLLFENIYPDLALLNNDQSPPYLRVNAGPCFATTSSAVGTSLSQVYAGFSVSFTIRCRDLYGNPSTQSPQAFFIFATANSFRKRAIHFSNELVNLESGNILASFLLNTQVSFVARKWV